MITLAQVSEERADGAGCETGVDKRIGRQERAGLLAIGSTVYLAWASHCDIRPYTGWVMAYNINTLAQTAVLNLTPNGNDGAIWNAGAGMAADATGNVFVLDGNGLFDATLTSAGFPNKGDYGNAFLKISTAKGGLAVADYFEMYNEAQENPSDTDLGSGGALLLNQNDSTGTLRQLAVGAGKDGNLYVVDRTNMGKFHTTNQNLQELAGGLPGGIWSMPAASGARIYYGPVGSPILAFQFTDAKLSTSPVVRTANSFGYPGTTPSVSSNLGKGGIVWAAENVSPAVLHAYNATSLNEIYNSNQAANGRDHFGNGNKFITPTIANGKVYVGTTNGVGVFGLLK